jgi:hypothetical protein
VITSTGFQIRAPWYIRDRGDFGLRDARSLRPSIQAYASTDYVDRIIEDPTKYLTPTPEDHWGLPVPVTPFGTGRSRLATHKMVRTEMRKLFQPIHDRFYAVVVEVFCDQPGLPRAGMHDDIEVGFVMRRQAVTFGTNGQSVRKLATNLVRDMAKAQRVAIVAGEPDSDVRELWWSDAAAKTFAEENCSLIDEVQPMTARQAWVKAEPTRHWAPADATALADGEETFPMWRLPPRESDCAATRTRSLWFGVIPTFSGEHGIDPTSKALEPKLDDKAIYDITCFVKQKPQPGHEHCPPRIWLSAASEPFRLASPMDPDGTKNRTVSITLPDLRALAARAGQPQGPGGVRIITPPKSQLAFNPFSGVPPPGSRQPGDGGGVCTFAIELFFIVAFFLFLMFLPIVVFAFQLWWMLALRFCIPPTVSFSALAAAAASGSLTVRGKAELDVVFGAAFTSVDTGDPVPPTSSVWFDHITANPPSGTPLNDFISDVVLAADPAEAVPAVTPEEEDSQKDPLCST